MPAPSTRHEIAARVVTGLAAIGTLMCVASGQQSATSPPPRVVPAGVVVVPEGYVGPQAEAAPTATAAVPEEVGPAPPVDGADEVDPYAALFTTPPAAASSPPAAPPDNPVQPDVDGGLP